MTDRELLKRVAKIAGIKVAWVRSCGYIRINEDGSHGGWWNPLESSADAFELAVLMDEELMQEKEPMKAARRKVALAVMEFKGGVE